MFDSAPPNLPVEPAPQAKPPAGMPPRPPMPGGMPPAMPTPPMAAMPGGKKEPEDIFSNLDTGGDTGPKASALPPAAPPHRGAFPVKAVIGGVVGLLVLGGGGFAAWSFLSAPKAAPEPIAQAPAPSAAEPPAAAPSAPAQVPPPSNAQAPAVTETPPAGQGTPGTPSAPTPVTTPPAGTNIPLPTGSGPSTETEKPAATPKEQVIVAASEGVDTDHDQLTDTEEALIGSDPKNPDTDGDGFADGTEVKGLYSPLAKGVSINALTTLKRLSLRGMSFLLPQGWKASQAPGDPSGLIIDTGSLAIWKLSSRDVDPASAKTYIDGLRAQPGATALSTKAGIEGVLLDGGLKLSFAVDGTIVDASYELNGAASIEYRTLFELMFRSLVRS